MNPTTKSKMKLTIQEITALGLMTAILSLGKGALAAIPNVEIVSFLIIVFTLFYGKKVLFAVFAFVFIEIFTYGLGLWTIMYIYIWPLLCLLTMLFKKIRHPLFWSILSGMFGFLFGALCCIPYFFIGGPNMAFTWWLSGLPWDFTHGVSNFLICLVMFIPVRILFEKVKTGFLPN